MSTAISDEDRAAFKQKQFYIPALNTFWDDACRSFYESYTGLKGEELENHIIDIRDRAFKVSPYPCLGSWTFLRYSLNRHKIYPELLERIRAGATVLDLGCGFGQDLRQILLECGGGDSSKLYATDMHDKLWEMGYELFGDRDRFRAKLVVSNLTDEKAPLWDVFEGGEEAFDIVIANAIFHFFDWDRMRFVLSRLTTRLTRKASVVVGTQLGRVEGKASINERKTSYRHDEESFRRIWAEVNEQTGAQWRVAQFAMAPLPKAMGGYAKVVGDDERVLGFTVIREG